MLTSKIREAVFIIIESVAKALWGPYTTIAVFGIGVIVTVRAGFPAFRPSLLISPLFSAGRSKNGGISPFSALMTALSGCIGVGNIIGVGTAITIGGAGALFWMWVSALSGMSVKFYEIWLAMRFRDPDRTGSPVQYISKGLKMPGLALVYAAAGFASSLATGNLVQSGALADLGQSRGIPRSLCVAALLALCLVISFKGIERLSSVLSKFMPIAITVYCTGCVLILFLCREKLPSVFSDIFSSAFDFRAVGGGAAGAAIMAGFSRGVFSNEAGVGTSCLSHCSSSENVPVRQAVWGIFEVFTDTLLICTLSGLVMLVTDSRGYSLACSDAFFKIFGEYGRLLTDVSLACFAFSTLAAWSFYGRKFYFMLGGKSKTAYFVIFSVFAVIGGFSKSDVLWYVSDIFNAAALIINLFALALLMPSSMPVLRADIKKGLSRK